MKAIMASIVGLIIVITVVFAQKPDQAKQEATDAIEYIKQETIGGKLDFRSVLENPGEVITHSNGVRFNKKDYYVFLWGESVRELGVLSTEKAVSLWEEIHGSKLTGPQRTALSIAVEGKFDR
jgi:hypothetical protein